MTDVLTEDTPPGSDEELRWRIERLVERMAELKAEIDDERDSYNFICNQRDHWRTKYENLRDSLTVEQLRAAGIDVYFEED